MMCQQMFDSMRKHGVWAVPTLTVDNAFGHLHDPAFCKDERLTYFCGEFRSWLEAKDDFRLKGYTDRDYEVERGLVTEKKKLVAAMYRAGVPILVGTDVGNPFCFPGFSLHDELALLVDSGLTPLAARLCRAARRPQDMPATVELSSDFLFAKSEQRNCGWVCLLF